MGDHRLSPFLRQDVISGAASRCKASLAPGGTQLFFSAPVFFSSCFFTAVFSGPCFFQLLFFYRCFFGPCFFQLLFFRPLVFHNCFFGPWFYTFVFSVPVVSWSLAQFLDAKIWCTLYNVQYSVQCTYLEIVESRRETRTKRGVRTC